MMSLTTKTKISKIIGIFAMLIFGVQLSFSNISSITINEINYRSINDGENIDFVELHNSGTTAINLSGWTLTDGIAFEFPAATSISAGGYIIIAANPADCQAVFGISGVLGPYLGSLSGDGDDVALRDANYNLIDEVKYSPWQEWPSVRHLNSGLSPASIQKLNPGLPGKYAGSWASASPSPKANNNSVLVGNANTIPVIQSVSKKPDAPISNQSVTIKVKVDNANLFGSSLSVKLQYQKVDAGNYISKTDAAYSSNWTNITMYDNGSGVDSLSNDGIYTLAIPSNVQIHRRLIRYRIQVSTSNGYQKIYPNQNHRESNYAYFVYDGQSSFNGIPLNQLSYLQEVHLLAKDNDVESYIDGTSYSLNDYPGEGTLVYRGEVYDHIGFRARGKDSRHLRLKKNIKFDLNSEHPIKVYNDYNKAYDVKRGKLSLSGTWVADGNSHGLTESLIYKIAELTGSVNKLVDYCQFRIIDGSQENTNSGDFRGVYLISEDFNADLLEEHGLPDGNLYSYKPFALSHQGENSPIGANNSIYTNWNNALDDSQDGCSNCPVPTQSQSFYRDNLALDLYYNDSAMNEICGNSETNYPGQHSYVEYYNPVTQKWMIRNADYDNMFGMPEDEKVIYPQSKSRDNRKVRGPLKDQLLTYTDFKKEIANNLRSTLDLLFNAEQLDHLLNSESAKIYTNGNVFNWTDADKSRWENQLDGHGYKMDYNNYQTDVIDWYRNWFNNRKNHLLNESTSYQDWDVDQNENENPIDNIYEDEDNKVPVKPQITYNGPNGYPLNQLSFNNSTFSDNTGNFAALEWRIGEWSDPSNPVYSLLNEPKYEIETKWSSGVISSFQNSISIPADAQLKAGRTYKIRVRYQDSTDRWSHWSDAITFMPAAASNAPNYNLTINEIMYNPSDNCGVEFIELFNYGTANISLSNFKFTEGIDFDFPSGSSIAAGSYLVLTNDSLEFVYKYGFSPFGDYKGKLANSMDTIILTGPYRVEVNSVTYLDNTPWVSEPDGNGPSLSLIQAGLDNSLATNWHYSFDDCGTPGANNNLCKPMTNNPTVADLVCYQINDGFIVNNVSGGTAPYSYFLNNTQTSSFINNLSSGNYSLTITDALLCKITQNITITQPSQMLVNVSSTNESDYQLADGTANVTVSGGTPPYTYSWSNGVTNASQSRLTPGTYTVTVTDYNNCSITSSTAVSGIATCRAVLNLLDNSILPSSTRKVSNYIKSNCIIDNNANVSFNAGYLIHLQNDFEVKQGATFEAIIKDCD